MAFVELFLIAIGLSMDAFALAVVSGLGMKAFTLRKALIVGLYFGVAQAIMPLLGYFIGFRFADRIAAFDHWITFGLMVLIGGKMIFESTRKEKEGKAKETSVSFKALFPLSIANSIDALAIGVTFAFSDINIFSSAAFIGAVTLLISITGVKIGNLFGLRFKSWAELAGGAILVLIGLKTLLEHTGLIP